MTLSQVLPQAVAILPCYRSSQSEYQSHNYPLMAFNERGLCIFYPKITPIETLEVLLGSILLHTNRSLHQFCSLRKTYKWSMPDIRPNFDCYHQYGHPFNVLVPKSGNTLLLGYSK